MFSSTQAVCVKSFLLITWGKKLSFISNVRLCLLQGPSSWLSSRLAPYHGYCLPSASLIMLNFPLTISGNSQLVLKHPRKMHESLHHTCGIPDEWGLRMHYKPTKQAALYMCPVKSCDEVKLEIVVCWPFRDHKMDYLCWIIVLSLVIKNSCTRWVAGSCWTHPQISTADWSMLSSVQVGSPLSIIFSDPTCTYLLSEVWKSLKIASLPVVMPSY